MVWIFVTAVFLVTVFLSVRYRAFRRGLLFTAVGAVALGAVGGAIAYLYDQQQEREQQRLRTLIKADDLKFDGLVLGQLSASSELWELKGNVTNLSGHHLDLFKLKITVQDCPEVSRCVVVGENEEMIWADVPPNQMRGFSDYVSFRNMPQLKNWKWLYGVAEVRAKAD